MRKLDLTAFIFYIQIILLAILLISGLFELIFFPSFANSIGIFVTVVSFILYARIVFRLEVMRHRPISFIAFSTLILFMYLPLPITLLDGNEMSHHLYNPITTYLLQLFYFVCCILAFVLAGSYSKSFHGISTFLKRVGFFTTPAMTQLWILGLIGWGFKYAIMRSQFSGDGLYQAGLGTLSLFASLIYAPLLILFFPLIGGRPAQRRYKIIVFLYMISMMILLVATNSRNQVVMPLITVLLCYTISLFYKRTIIISKFKIITSILLILLMVGPLSDMAFAMLVARSQRQNTKFTVLLDKTMEIFNNKEKLYRLKSLAEKSINKSDRIKTADWDEYYVSSIFLNRVCNYRVVDASIYHAQRAGIPNQYMMDDFLTRLMIMFPQPIVDLLFGHIDKAKYAYSPQDKLYAVSTNRPLQVGYKVGGDVGLALSIFGFMAFPIIVLIYMFEFVLFDNLSLKRRGIGLFSFITLISIYSTFFLRYVVGGGIFSHFISLIWGIPFNMFCLLVVYNIVRIVIPYGKQ